MSRLMSTRNLKSVSQNELLLHEELIEHIEEAYALIFPRQGISLETALNHFYRDLENWEYCGCLQSIISNVPN